jgi:hypothetical protein
MGLYEAGFMALIATIPFILMVAIPFWSWCPSLVPCQIASVPVLQAVASLLLRLGSEMACACGSDRAMQFLSSPRFGMSDGRDGCFEIIKFLRREWQLY